MGRFIFRSNMKNLVKITLVADELGVSVKTIYNWITLGKLEMVEPGFVRQIDAYEVWLQQRSLKSMFAISRVRQGIKRDSSGRFIHIPKTGE
jgi:transposase